MTITQFIFVLKKMERFDRMVVLGLQVGKEIQSFLWKIDVLSTKTYKGKK